MEHLPYKDSLRAGVAHPGEEMNLGRSDSSLSVSKGGGVREKGTDSLAGSVLIGQGKCFQTKRGEI